MRGVIRLLFCACATIVSACSEDVDVPLAKPPSWTFTTLDHPDFVNVTSPITMNKHGDVVGYYDDKDGHYRGYLLPQGGTFIPVDVPGASQTVPTTITDDGDIVGVYFDQEGFQHGFLSRSGTFTVLDHPDAAQTKDFYYEFGTGLGTSAGGLNLHGDIVGQYATSDGTAHGFLLQGSQWSSFDAPGTQGAYLADTMPTQISKNGHIVGGSRAGEYGVVASRGFLLVDGVFTVISVPEAVDTFGTIATGINDHGDIVGSYSGPTNDYYDFHGFALMDGKYIRIDVPGAKYSETFTINNDKHIAGAYGDSADRIHGFIGTYHQ